MSFDSYGLPGELRLWEKRRIGQVPITDPCGKCGKIAMVKTEYEDPKELKYPWIHYYCEMCGWEYIEK